MHTPPSPDDHPLRRHPLLAELRPHEALEVQAAFTVRDLVAGTVLVRAGDAGGTLHVVETGWFDVLDAIDGGLTAQVTGGAVVGELGFLRRVPSAATVRATTDAVVHTLAAADAHRLARTYAGFALALGQAAAERVVDSTRGPVRPTITATIEVGDWSPVRGPILKMFHGAKGRRTVELADFEDGPPGSAAHGAATRLLAPAFVHAHEVLLWATTAEPGLSRAVRNADRVLLLNPPGQDFDAALARRIAALPANTSANVISVVADPRVDEPWVGPSPIDGVRMLRMPTRDMVHGALREFGRLRHQQQVVAQSPIFGSLPATAQQDFTRHLAWQARESGEAFYEAGEAIGGLYLVLSGRVVEQRGGRMTAYTPGFVFGDPGLGRPRVAEVAARARRQTYAAFVDRAALERLMNRHDDLRAALSHQASADVAGTHTAALADRASIAVILPDDDPRWRARLERLCATFGGPGASRLVDRAAVGAALDPSAIESPAGSPADNRLRTWCAAIEAETRYPIFVARCDDAPWVRRCLGQTDHLLVCADGADGEPDPLARVGVGINRQLALFWPAGTPPTGTGRWLAACADVAVWHHVRADHPEDVGRLTRRLLGRATGLVLGGASSRGVAHLGVAEAIGAAGMPIDTFGGTSSGTGLAGLLCLDLDDEERRRIAIEATTGFGAGPDNVGPPLVSLFSGRRATSIARDLFGDARIEDLPRPFKATAVDLRTGRIEVLDRGPLWLAVRAACSVPALWPPVADGGRLLIDGGVLDNFPHWLLEAECSAGLTVVSNLDAGYRPPFALVPDYGAVFSGWRALWARLVGRRHLYPDLGSTVIECLVMGGRSSSADLESRVDPERVLVVRPPIPRVDLFGLEEGAMVEALLTAARASTTEALAAWQARRGPRPAVGHEA